MAAKRIAQSTFNWAALAERVPPHQKTEYLAFKTKSDNYVRRMMANPEFPPAIDWQYYVNTVPIPGLVEDFKKKYESYQIPIPAADAHYAQLAELEKSFTQDIAKFKSESSQRIAEYEEKVKKVKATIPYDQMTYEELAIYSPEIGWDPKKPFFYPEHLEEKKGDHGH